MDKTRGALMAFALVLALVAFEALAADSFIDVYSIDSYDGRNMPDSETTTKLNEFLNQHPELTGSLNGKKIKAIYSFEWKRVDGAEVEMRTLKLQYPNGVSTKYEFPARDGDRENYVEDYEKGLVQNGGLAQLKAESIDSELKWLRDQLSQRLTDAKETDAAVIQKLIARIDAIKGPAERAGLLRQVPKSEAWLKKNYATFSDIRDEAKIWGHELGFDVISFEEKRLSDQALLESQRFLKPVRSLDRPLVDKVWDNIDGKQLRKTVEERGGTVKIAFEEPKWVIEPKGKMPGRAALKAVVTVTKADGTTQTIEVVGKINTGEKLEAMMAEDQWVKPFVEEFQAKVANEFVAIDAFLAPSAQRVAATEAIAAPQTKVRVGDVVAEPADCNEAVDAVARVIEN